VELERFGSAGVLRGLEAVKTSGSSYAPNLNKFIGYCIESSSASANPGDSFSEQLHGAMKPTPNGVPLCWTVGKYTHEDMIESGHSDDNNIAMQTNGEGWKHPDYVEYPS